MEKRSNRINENEKKSASKGTIRLDVRIDLSAERALMRGEEEEVISLLFYSRLRVPVRACVRACVKYIVWMEHEEKVCFELCFTNETHRARDLLHSVASQKID